MRLDRHHDEVLVGLEEWELFEKTLPRNALALGDRSCNQPAFFELSQQNLLGRMRNIERRVAVRETWSQDWHLVVVPFLKQFFIDRERHKVFRILNLRQMHWVVWTPVIRAVKAKEDREELVNWSIRVIDANFGDQHRPSNTSDVTKHV